MRAVLGNRHAAIHPTGTDEKVAEPVVLKKGKRATVIDFPDGITLAEAFKNVTDPQGVWAHHTTGTPGEGQDPAPAWVASDSEALALVLADHFGGIEIRELEDPYGGSLDPDRGDDGSGGGSARGVAQAPLMLMLALPVLLWMLARLVPMLKTNAGNDFQAAQMAGAASATAVAKWVALTANTTAPAAGDTTLTAEITTGGGGLIRKVGTYAHTTGAASYTITTTFTANGSDSLPVTIGKRGHFDAASAGNMVFETLVSPTATLSASGDALTLTDTISL